VAVTASRRRRRESPAEQYLPVAYFAAMALVALIALPSALRPPSQQPNQTAELSPDAPPDKSQTAIISALNRGSSGVATSPDQSQPQGEQPAAQGEPPTTRPAVAPPRACPSGIGNPPRQVESIYAPPCAPPFQGDNGGATYEGVTENEIRIGVRGTGAKGGANDCGNNGPIDKMDPTTMDAATRTFFVLEKYFNKNFQLYNRRLSFYCIEPATLMIADESAEAASASQDYHIFGTPTGNSISCQPLINNKLVVTCEGLLDSFYQKNAPYAWASWQSATDQIDYLVEQVCTMLANKPASFSQDPTLNTKTRKFASVIYDGGRGFSEDADYYRDQLKQKCNVDVDIYRTSLDDQQGESQLASAAAQMKQNGDTTITPGVDWVSLATLTNAAANIAYFPEWYIGDGGGLSRNQLGQLQNQAEWQGAFGLTAEEPERPENQSECWRAYHSIDPANNPNDVICRYQWHEIIQYIAGIQQAGPHLTPQSYQQGWFKVGMRYYTKPTWAVGGGYAPGVYDYPHNVALMWWNPRAQDPYTGSSQGAYMYLYGAQRFCKGHLPAAAVNHYFKEADSVLLPPDYNSTTLSQPQTTCPDSGAKG
jgi:hypothetical protein